MAFGCNLKLFAYFCVIFDDEMVPDMTKILEI